MELRPVIQSRNKDWFFSGLHQRHVEIPRLWVKSELQLLAYATVTATSDPSWVCNLHHAHGNTGSLTHWVGPGIKPASSWILVGFATAEPRWKLQISRSWLHSQKEKTVLHFLLWRSSGFIFAFFIDGIKAVDVIRMLDEVDTTCEISSN